ncbi:MAG: glycosyl hydrolase family 5 [Terriglobales bacterium]
MARNPTGKSPVDRSEVTRRRFLGESMAAGLAAGALARWPAAARAEGWDAATAPETTPLVVAAGRAVNRFDPDQALGSSMDILSPEIIPKIYTPEMVATCLSTGWGPITYRNHTELAIQAWHWNPNGAWSDPARQEGYFTGSTELGTPIHDSFGYDLPRRGTTRDGGADSGYSRLTDGDATTFWKSNPYLTSAYTGEDDARHPQWVIVDQQSAQPVNAIRIAWAEPSARVYDVQYWTGEDPMRWEGQYSPGGSGVGRQANGRWNLFPNGAVRDGQGGTVLLRLAEAPLSVRWLRVLMSASNGKALPGASDDARERMGYAIHEIGVGSIGADGGFLDLVTHTPDANQTPTYCSSTDPWHRAGDKNERADQTGMDLFFTSGITNRLPAVIPVAVLFGTPEDAAAQIAYLKQRGYPVGWVEMGEECDGQYAMPEDYGALYLQVAAAIHRVAPEAKLGGPVFQGINQDITVWPDADGRSSWFARFLDYLRARGRLDDLAFVSFEHYPFDPCTVGWADLFREPELTRSCLDALRQDGLPVHVPLMNTESNLSWELSEYMADIFAGLWLADSVGAFFLAGGAAYFHSPIQPEPVRPACHGWATWGNFIADADLKVRGYTAQYFVGQMINREWARHGAGMHRLYAAAGSPLDAAGRALVTSYALERPDGEWALLIINKDPDREHRLRPRFERGGGAAYFAGAVRQVTFGREQYVWHADGPGSYVDPDGPAVASQQAGGAAAEFVVPKASVTVLRGRIG